MIDVNEAPGRPSELSLYDRIRARCEPLGSVDLELPPRDAVPDPPINLSPEDQRALADPDREP